MSGPLDGLRVVELARTLAGPYCGMLLADMGAEVIKVEQASVGDETRGYSPPEMNGESSYYLSLNRNKKGITANLKTKEGQQIVKRLVGESDVLIENFRYGAMEKFGLNYDVLKKINPRLVYCAVTGFGRTGPMKDEPGYDLLLQGFGGIMSVTGETDRLPMRVGFSVVDLTTGIYASNAILLALLVREKTGQGQYVETSLMESIISLQSYHAQAVFATGQAPKRFGTGHPNIVPYQVFETKDGYIIIAVPNDWLWKKMCDALGLKILRDDPRFATNADRVAYREKLIPLMMDFISTKKSSEILTKLKDAGIPCGPVNDIAQALAHPQVSHRGMIQEVEHPTIGTLKVLGIPMKLSETPGAIRMPPPLLGQHTREVLLDLGYSNNDVTHLKKKGVI
jgi:crotonobetainyl-CoA:carnitine CoA-transferase CaiB-like acyl-CoA transferase